MGNNEQPLAITAETQKGALVNDVFQCGPDVCRQTNANHSAEIKRKPI